MKSLFWMKQIQGSVWSEFLFIFFVSLLAIFNFFPQMKHFYYFTSLHGLQDVENHAVTLRPNWPTNYSKVDIPISTSVPLQEEDYNAFNFSLWNQFGQEILLKSNIMTCFICSPKVGNFVKWRDGAINCKVAKRISKVQ